MFDEWSAKAFSYAETAASSPCRRAKVKVRDGDVL
jgi:hypothetical protein